MPHSWLANFSAPGAHTFPKGKGRGRAGRLHRSFPKLWGRSCAAPVPQKKGPGDSSKPAWVDSTGCYPMDLRAGGGSHPKHSLPGNWGSRAGPRWLQGHKATVPCDSEGSIRNKPTGSWSTALVSGCGESQDKRSMMPESMWQLESEENFICY